MTTKKVAKKRAVRSTERMSEKVMAEARAIREARNAALKEAVNSQPGMRIEMVPDSPPALPPAPLPPNPTVLRLQEQILGLVDVRSEAQRRLHEANARLRMAQAEVEAAREWFSQSEGEVQYRLQLVAQIESRPVMQGYLNMPMQASRPVDIHTASSRFAIPTLSQVDEKMAYSSANDSYRANDAYRQQFNTPVSGISSIPAPSRRFDQADGIVGEARTESAEEIRAAL